VKISFGLGYEVAVLAIPRCLYRIAVRTVKAVPRLTTVLGELRDAVTYLERLATFAAGELPEVVYQLEKIREQLAAIERKLAGEAELPAAEEIGQAVTPDERRTGSRRPS
jgi:uncharacterized membrane protein